MKKQTVLFLTMVFLIISIVVAQENKATVYFFWGQGCPHCVAEKAFLETLKEKYPQLEVKSFEVYLNEENRELFSKMCKAYGFEPRSVPTIFIGEKFLVGYADDATTGATIENEIINCIEDGCIDPGEKLKKAKTDVETIGLTTAKIVSLAAVDAVNPCALAVLSLILIALITYNPKNKRNVLLGGLAFTLSVFVIYFLYGLVIIKFFQVIQVLTSIRLFLYKLLGVVAVILGILNVKDFFFYKPGGFGTEMPMSLRPKVKKIVSGITSPKGAFVVGAFVTIFLLPCTIGPYIIAGGILSTLELVKTIPWLLIYNIIFILPMLVITGIVYAGITGIENVSKWKDKNIRYLHLIAGAIILCLGIIMIFGWI